ncbi:hypothetical protein [Bradyrhizobium sp. Tv2a-2]|uniref:hypothetical protein n=1 Tax=Bradyrhizobium sp. Tv2a-2 TaxID=113395 RepID=UPI0003FA25D0|nr:hypothetical protein [Bradyrhizobium sp. Tv2a-2]
MTIFLILAPYGAFTFLMLVAPAVVSVFAGSLIALAVITLDAVRGRSLKIFGVGGALVFAAIGFYLVLVDPSLAASKVRLAVDTGILIVAAGSMLVRFPFTLQYALEAVPAETAAMPGFLRANYMITGAWAAASLLMMLSNLAVLYVPGLPIWTSLLIAFAARNSALYFTKWYPHYRERKYGAPLAAALPGTN